MAIIVGHEESKVNWFAIAVAMFIIFFVAGAIYFLFFAQPPFIERIAPIDLTNVSELTQSNVNPDAVLQNPSFLVLKKYVPDPDTGKLGRANPFLKLR